MIAVEDTGRGMDAERLREITRNLFNSSKAADPKTIGEKAIGILAFQQLGGRCDIVTRPVGSAETLALRLVRGSPRAGLEPNERRRARNVPGTTVYVSDLDPDVLRVLTLRKVVDYLRRRRGHALAPATTDSRLRTNGQKGELKTWRSWSSRVTSRPNSSFSFANRIANRDRIRIVSSSTSPSCRSVAGHREGVGHHDPAEHLDRRVKSGFGGGMGRTFSVRLNPRLR